jgi:twitching motility protein PilT
MSVTTSQENREATPETGYRLDDLLVFMVQQEASDLHLKPMRPPLLRLKGKLIPLKGAPLRPDDLDRLLRDRLNERQTQALEQRQCCEFGYSVPGVSRFRGTVFFQRGTLGAVFRRVPFKFPSLDDWKLPDVLKELIDLRQGLVLVTGPTGSGKSSTLAALMHEIINKRLVHIVTIEDPIEFLLNDGLASVTQREVGADTPTFESALRNALRQDPDVIMVGENRDLNTMSTTLTAAETGHVVFTTLHTNSAAQTIDRIIDMFPAEQHRQVRQQLSQVLKAVISMHLVERADGQGLVAAIEILRDSPRASKLIKDGNIADLHEEIERSVDFHRMQSMNQSLAALVIHGVITRETAIQNSTNAADLDLMLRKFFFGATRRQSQSGEEQEMPSDADYSRIHKLLEIEKLYDDLQERHHQEVHDRDQRIRELQHELRARMESDAQSDTRVRSAEEERDRAARAVESQRVEFETQIQRLQARIRELQSTGADPAGGRGGGGGLFRR